MFHYALVEPVAGNFRVLALVSMAPARRLSAAQREITTLDKKLCLQVNGKPETHASRRAAAPLPIVNESSAVVANADGARRSPIVNTVPSDTESALIQMAPRYLGMFHPPLFNLSDESLLGQLLERSLSSLSVDLRLLVSSP